MNKSDLKTGMVVTLRNGLEQVVLTNCATKYQTEEIIIVNGRETSWEALNDYNEDLTCNSGDSYDIVKVELLSHPYAIQDIDYDRKNRVVLWEREEVKIPTEKDIEIMKAVKLLYGYKWFAKDKDDGRVFAYSKKPNKKGERWTNYFDCVLIRDLSHISWEDNEPYHFVESEE